MALDVGGGSGRCLLLEVDTGRTFEAKRTWSHPVAPGTAGLGYDVDLADIWGKLCEASRQAMEAAGAGPSQVLAVAVSSMRNTTVLLDAAGEALFAAPNHDARALGESSAWAAEAGGAVHDITGHWPSPLFTGTRLMWLRANAPELLEAATAALSLSDWVGFRLCGEARAEASQAGETLMFDHRMRDWAFDLIDSAGFKRSIFPEVVSAGTPIGRLKDSSAGVMGLSQGIPVVAGGADTQCALLGAGAVRPGDTCVVAGITMPVQFVTGSYATDTDGCLWSGQHVVPGLFVVESNGMASGEVLEWLAGILYPDFGDPIGAMYAEAGLSEPGAAGAYSTFGAGIFDGRMLSMQVGNLTASHMATPGSAAGRRHIARAAVEGVAFSARANLEQIERLLGIEPKTITVAGGMSRSRLWTGILCDVLGKSLSVPSTHEVTSLGTAICAAVGAGIFSSLEDGAARTAGNAREHSPGPDSGRYQAVYGAWLEAMDLRGKADARVSMAVTMSLLQGAGSPTESADPSFRPRIKVTAETDPEGLEELGGIGEVEYAGWRSAGTVYPGGAELTSALKGFEVFVTEMDVVDFEAMRDLPGLRAIITCRGNPVNVDIESATAFGIPVMNTPGRNADAVADIVVGFMIMLARKMPDAALFLKNEGVEAGDLARMGEAYAAYRGRELWRKTVGIIGLGMVGEAVARRLRAFGASVLFFDPFCDAYAGALCGAAETGFEELLAGSDFVTVHAPASESTRNLMGRAEFSRMKDGAFFVNTSRASLVDDDALVEALESGKLAGAALDVFSVEPPGSDDRLAGRDDVIATPHIGGNTAEVGAHQAVMVAAQLRRLLSGSTPDHILNPEVMESFSWTGARQEPSTAEAERLAARPKPRITS